MKVFGGITLSGSEYSQLLMSGMPRDDISAAVETPYLLVDLATDPPSSTNATLPPCVVIGCTNLKDEAVDEQWARWIDTYVDDLQQLECLIEAIQVQPIAAAVLVQVLRHNELASIDDGLFAESLAYSNLQHSVGFKHWLMHTTPKLQTAETQLVIAEYQANTLHITLNRPSKHNAYSQAMKDALCATLEAALLNPNLERVVWRGRGTSFCAGGDLTEFGQATDAALAHLSRNTRQAGSLLALLSDRLYTSVHGACIGAGIELPAFGEHIEADPSSVFQLPEVNMGLIPGAGGTVSILQRIGRHRLTAWALSGEKIDAPTALSWGLIDEISSQPKDDVHG